MTSHQRRHLLLQIVRRFIQAAAMLLVVTLIFLGLYSHYYASRTLDAISTIPGWRGHILSLVDHCMGAVETPEALLKKNNGNLWSMRLVDIPISDPLAFAEATAATHTVHMPLLASILIPVLMTLVLGRVFCSWICPGYVLFELAGKLRPLLRIGKVEPPQVEFSSGNKYLFLCAGLAVTALTGLPIFSLLYPPALLSRTAHAIIFGTSVAGMLMIIALTLGFEVFASPRWWCRSMCPGGALYGLLGTWRPLRVLLLPGRCTSCRLCEPACEEGLNPVKESSGIECDNCGDCVRACPEQALAFAFCLPGGSKKKPTTGNAGGLRQTRIANCARIENQP